MVDEILRDATQHMQSTIKVVTHEFNTLRTGHASISILDDIVVDYYGVSMPMNQLANLSAPDANLLVVQPYDKGAIGAIEKAIHGSALGLNPNSDGTTIRLPIPELTEERRVELTKVVGRQAEQGKTAIRNVRRDANDRIKRLQTDKEITEDDEHAAHKSIQDLTDEYVQRIDDLAERKKSEILAF